MFIGLLRHDALEIPINPCIFTFLLPSDEIGGIDDRIVMIFFSLCPALALSDALLQTCDLSSVLCRHIFGLCVAFRVGEDTWAVGGLMDQFFSG